MTYHWMNEPTKKTLLGLVRYGTLGVVTLVTNVVLTAFLHEVLQIREEVAFAFGLAAVFIISFVGLRYVVFENASDGDPKKQAVSYLFSSLGFRGTEFMGFLVLHTVLGIYYLVAIFGVLIVSFFAKYCYYRRAVFAVGQGSIPGI